ncbi:hypothetical protein T492DRAFT_845903 [Pavlovales sp. CCMP2436]|nr:hypothetical protein T492DRAFT_845903 [Pavlovales sp. CCMP2436]
MLSSRYRRLEKHLFGSTRGPERDEQLFSIQPTPPPLPRRRPAEQPPRRASAARRAPILVEPAHVRAVKLLAAETSTTRPDAPELPRPPTRAQLSRRARERDERLKAPPPGLTAAMVDFALKNGWTEADLNVPTLADVLEPGLSSEMAQRRLEVTVERRNFTIVDIFKEGDWGSAPTGTFGARKGSLPAQPAADGRKPSLRISLHARRSSATLPPGHQAGAHLGGSDGRDLSPSSTRSPSLTPKGTRRGSLNPFSIKNPNPKPSKLPLADMPSDSAGPRSSSTQRDAAASGADGRQSGELGDRPSPRGRMVSTSPGNRATGGQGLGSRGEPEWPRPPSGKRQRAADEQKEVLPADRNRKAGEVASRAHTLAMKRQYLKWHTTLLRGAVSAGASLTLKYSFTFGGQNSFLLALQNSIIKSLRDDDGLDSSAEGNKPR